MGKQVILHAILFIFPDLISGIVSFRFSAAVIYIDIINNQQYIDILNIM